MTLDRAYTDEIALVQRLEQLLGARVHRVAVRRVDLVNDTTLVDVRFELPEHQTVTHRLDDAPDVHHHGGEG